MPLDKQAIDTLSGVSTATLTTVMLKLGLRNIWMRGARPTVPGRARIVGPAFTLRFVPYREDLATPDSWSSSKSSRAAIEEMPEGCVVVVDAMRVCDSAIVGDILCARMRKLGVLALVTDGVVRDLHGVIGTGLPVWCNGAAAPPSIAALTFVDWQQPVACGGIAVIPDDIIVADDDGAVLIPSAFLDQVLSAAPEQEQLEDWIMQEIQNGAALTGLYPINEENAARYKKSRLA